MYREHCYGNIKEDIERGLSLCIQGTYRENKIPSYRYRFIPVYTGNIVKTHDHFGDGAVYPCVYREHKKHALQTTHNPGLSLCIQGTYIKHSEIKQETRFIPVYTGNIG